MVSPLSGVGDKFTKSFLAARSLKIKREAAEANAAIKEKQENLKGLKQLGTILKSPDPNIRRGMATLYMRQLGMDTKSEESKVVLDMLKSADDRSVAFLSDAIKAFGAESKGGVGAKALLEGFVRNPGDFAERVNKYRMRKVRESERADIFAAPEAGPAVIDKGVAGQKPVTSSELKPPDEVPQGLDRLRAAHNEALRRGDTDSANEFRKAIKQEVDAALADRRAKSTEKTEARQGAKPIAFVDPDTNKITTIQAGDLAGLKAMADTNQIPLQLRKGDTNGLSKTDRSKLEVGARKNRQAIIDGSDILRRLKVNPKLIGIPSKLFGSEVAGALDQALTGAGAPELVKSMSKYLTNQTPEQLKKFQTDAQQFMVKSVPLFTGEESSRISEPEREITTKIQALNRPFASPEQAMGAITSVIQGHIVRLAGKAIEDGKPMFKIPDQSDRTFAAVFAKVTTVAPSMAERDRLELADLLMRQAAELQGLRN